MVRFLLGEGASPDMQDGMGSTPLHEAVRQGNLEMVTTLLNANANPNIRDAGGKTALLQNMPQKDQFSLYKALLMYETLGEVTRNGEVIILDPMVATPNEYAASVRRINVQNGRRQAASVLATDNFGNNAIHVATVNGADVRVLNEFLFLGADINARNNAGQTPISLSIDYRNPLLISFLVDKGADLHSEDIDGFTPLSKVCQTYNDLLQFLITPKNANTRNAYGNTALHAALMYGTSGALLELSDVHYTLPVAEQVRYLLSIGADPEAKNRDGTTPLHIAVSRNLSNAGSLLISRGASFFSVDAKGVSPLQIALTQPDNSRDWIFNSRTFALADSNGNTILHYVAELGIDRIIPDLLQRGINVNARNAAGETALFSAIKANRPTMLDVLIQAGVSKEMRDSFGNSALHLCVKWSSLACLEILIASGADVNVQNGTGKTPLSDAVRTSNLKMAEFLLDNGANINAADTTGKTILMDALQSGDVACLRMLLNRGADILAQEMNGNTIYHQAAKTGDIDMLNLLRNAGANPLVRDANGATPFTLVLGQSMEVVRAVLGTSPYLADSSGNTPLHLAALAGAPPDKIQALIDMKYPVNRRNSSGVTALSLAVQSGDREVLDTLLSAGADPFIADNVGLTAITSAAQIAAYKPSAINLLTDIISFCEGRTDPSGNSPLHLIAQINDLPLDVVRRAVSLYGNKDMQNVLGETAYDIAKRWQKNNVIIEIFR